MHNHDIISSEALFFKAVDKDVEDEILDLFENLNGPEKARRMYMRPCRNELQKEYCVKTKIIPLD